MNREWIVALALLTAACGQGKDARGPDAGRAITRERFIEVYVDLRLAAADTRDARLFQTRKADILRRHSVTPEALTSFVERHAGDPAYLAEVWSEIDERLRPPPDSLSGPR